MERNGNGKVIAIVALVVAVVGLSPGFAAYSTYLRVGGAATVQTDTSNWQVGFSTNGTTIEALNGTNTKNGVNVTTGHTSDGGSVTVSRYTITQATNPILTTKSGSSVSYTLSVLNNGSLDATLTNVTIPTYPVSCAYVTGSQSGAGADDWLEAENNTQEPYAGTKRTAGTGDISDADCNAMFGVTLSINDVDYTSSTTGTGTLSKKTNDTPGSHPVVLTLAYKGNAAADAAAANLSGDIEVTINPIGVVYTSAH